MRNTLSKIIIGLAIKIHCDVGPGLLESAYRKCLIYELNKAGVMAYEEVPMPLIYEEIKLDQGYRLDILVENKVVIEIKCVDQLAPVYMAQVLTYMKLGGFKLGLLINFYEKLLNNGIQRFIM